MSETLDKYELLYEDSELILVNKPSNLLVHHSHYARNIREESLVQLLRQRGDIYPVHRLDRKTSGIMVFARNQSSAKFLQDQFERNEITKTYFALVRGYVEAQGSVDTPVKNEDTGKYREALTHYESIAQVEADFPVAPYPSARYSLLRLTPKTGRMHQLRKHMNKIAHPIIGDTKYGNRHHNHTFKDRFGHSRLYLHAHKLSFTHPESGQKLTFKAGFPKFWKEDLTVLGFQEINLDDL
ncbi:MAG: pseudouridine synthase [Crocinitomicaceae bacterium]|nr:pseudouridine synthase [Crocinitomicaceae bacterium]